MPPVDAQELHATRDQIHKEIVEQENPDVRDWLVRENFDPVELGQFAQEDWSQNGDAELTHAHAMMIGIQIGWRLRANREAGEMLRGEQP